MCINNSDYRIFVSNWPESNSVKDYQFRESLINRKKSKSPEQITDYTSVSRSQVHFPSVVQAYTQPYSFGGRIKLIIWQIRHELSVIIHEISTNWKKTLDGGPYTKSLFNVSIVLHLFSLSVSDLLVYITCFRFHCKRLVHFDDPINIIGSRP